MSFARMDGIPSRISSSYIRKRFSSFNMLILVFCILIASILSVTAILPSEFPSPHSTAKYRMMTVDLLPFGLSSSDSSAYLYYVDGIYEDQTSFSYPICSFTKVCATPTFTLFTITNLTIHTALSWVFPHCNTLRSEYNYPICRCFHPHYRPGLLPFPNPVTEAEREEARRSAVILLQTHIGVKYDWQNLPTEDYEISLEMLKSSEVYQSADEDSTVPLRVTEDSDLYSKLFSSPFHSKSHGSSELRGALPLLIKNYPHYWSINKWVHGHHIAHWAQKLMMMQAGYGHYTRACTRVYKQVENRRRDIIFQEMDAIELNNWETRVSRNRPPLMVHKCFPEISGVLFHDSATPLTDHEDHLLNLSISALNVWTNSDHLAETILSHMVFSNSLFNLDRNNTDIKDEKEKPAPVYTLSCFNRLSHAPRFGNFFENAYDSEYFRMAAKAHYVSLKNHRTFKDISPFIKASSEFQQIQSTNPYKTSADAFSILASDALIAEARMACPPSRVILVTRPDRAILNAEEIKTYLFESYRIRMEIVGIDASTPSHLQSSYFSTSGLILSAHSSQLVNVLFAPTNGAVIEIAPEFYNPDFFEYANSVGVFFRYALGGSIPDGFPLPDPRMNTCTSLAHACDGDSFCSKQVYESSCRSLPHFPNKHKAFHANMTAVKRSIKQAITHILWNCYGRWG